MATTATQYSDLLDAVRSYYGTSDEWAEIAKYGLKADNCYDILKQVPGVNITMNKNGDVVGYTVSAQSTIPVSDIPSAINSNAQSGQYGSTNSIGFNSVGGANVDQQTGDINMSSDIPKNTGGVAGTAKAIAGTVTAAMAGVSIGSFVGKTINSALYEHNPNFWQEVLTDAGDEPQLDQFYKDIVNFEDWIDPDSDVGERYSKLNALVGYGPDNRSTLYLDEKALALFAWQMKKYGLFSDGTFQPPTPTQTGDMINATTSLRELATHCYETYVALAQTYGNTSAKRYIEGFGAGLADSGVQQFISEGGNKIGYVSFGATGGWNRCAIIYYDVEPPITYDTTTRYTQHSCIFNATNSGGYTTPTISTGRNVLSEDCVSSYSNFNPDGNSNVSYKCGNGNASYAPSVDGVGNQSGATLPDYNNWNSINDVLPSLQNSYPSAWNNAYNVPVVQPDGSIKNYVYIPVPTPDGETVNEGGLPNPTTTGDTSNQSDPTIDPSTITEPILNFFRQLLSNPETTPTPQPSDPTKDPVTNTNENPPATGAGNTPTILPPTGNASSLWKVYHPTQAQVDAFGAWLWSSNFVEQIKKMFNDPMQSIIGLHKIFAAPVDAGTATIKVGYLDSQVASAYVDSQYVTVDCGSITLREYFGNVFDYEPHTKVAIFLPFIGIQKLDVAEVMRSTISVMYHVDVFSGACLAEVAVTRDGGGGCLYTFSGDASARYPISSGSYMGIVSGVLSIAGGIAGTIATGGAALPAVVGAGVAATHMHTDVKHSGQISGNAGAMGGKVPYLIVVRPQTEIAERSARYYGYGANTYCKVESLTGYARLFNAVVRPNNSITDEERKEIQTILESGFYA